MAWASPRTASERCRCVARPHAPQVRQFLDDVQFEVTNQLTGVVRDIQRELRDEFTAALGELQRTYTDAAKSAQEDAQRSQSERSQRGERARPVDRRAEEARSGTRAGRDDAPVRSGHATGEQESVRGRAEGVREHPDAVASRTAGERGAVGRRRRPRRSGSGSQGPLQVAIAGRVKAGQVDTPQRARRRAAGADGRRRVHAHRVVVPQGHRLPGERPAARRSRSGARVQAQRGRPRHRARRARPSATCAGSTCAGRRRRSTP